MGDVDVTDAAAVGTALAAWAATELDPSAALAEPPTPISGGLDSHLHGVRLCGDALPAPWRAPLVVRIVPTLDRAERARREAAVQRWATAQGYDAPAVLEVFDADGPLGLPAQVMARVPGTTMAAAVSSKPWRTGREVDRLAALARRLHALPVDGWPGPTDPRALVDQRLSLPRRTVAQGDHPELATALRRVEELGPEALAGDRRVVCHGDFHPLNVVVDGGRAWVLDWTDAGLGPPEADVARTSMIFKAVAPLAASRAWERVVLARIGPRLAARYRRAYADGAPLDARLLRRWEALHALHGWSQIVALHRGAFAGASSADGRQDDIPLGLADGLRAEVEAALAETA